jgi:hypothetical protein
LNRRCGWPKIAVDAQRMRALRERARHGLRRFTISVSADDLSVIAEHGYGGALSSDHDQQAQAIGLFLTDIPCTVLATEGQNRSTSAERMRALRERPRRALRLSFWARSFPASTGSQYLHAFWPSNVSDDGRPCGVRTGHDARAAVAQERARIRPGCAKAASYR